MVRSAFSSSLRPFSSSTDGIVSSHDVPKKSPRERRRAVSQKPESPVASAPAGIPAACPLRSGESVAVPGVGTIGMNGSIARRECFSVNDVPVTHFNMRFPLPEQRLWCTFDNIDGKASHVMLTFVRMDEEPSSVTSRWEEGIVRSAKPI